MFAGFPPRKTELREKFLSDYKSSTVPVILMDTPYRLTKMLEEVQTVFGKNQQILLACDMTLKKKVSITALSVISCPRWPGKSGNLS